MSKMQILVPLDGTDFSRRIEPEVTKLFPADRWQLRLLHVARVPADPAAAAYQPAAVGPDYRLYLYGYEMPGADLHPMYDEERLEEFRESLEGELQNEVRLFREQGYEVDAAVHFGEPADAIVAYAEETGVDLVAMATHHRKGFERLLYGSVARRALNRLTVPALLLRVADDDEPARERVAGGAGRERVSSAVSGTAEGRSHRTAHEERQRSGERSAESPLPPKTSGSAVPRDDSVVTPADTEPATLGGLEGRGVLTVTHDDRGRPIETRGSWFPGDSNADLSALEQAQQMGRHVLFEGHLVDAETAGFDHEHDEQVRREVSVSSLRRYQDYGGETRTLVSFELSGEPDRTDVPDQYTRTEFKRLDLRTIANITGLEAPANMNAEAEAEYREKAWRSYELDIEHRDEWGTARQNTSLPPGE